MDKIITIDDIIQDMVEETGKSEELIRRVVTYNIKYLQNITKTEPEVIAINLPNLGILRANYLNTWKMKHYKIGKERTDFLNASRTKEYKSNFRRPLYQLLRMWYKSDIYHSFENMYEIIKDVSFRNNLKNNEIYQKNN